MGINTNPVNRIRPIEFNVNSRFLKQLNTGKMSSSEGSSDSATDRMNDKLERMQGNDGQYGQYIQELYGVPGPK